MKAFVILVLLLCLPSKGMSQRVGTGVVDVHISAITAREQITFLLIGPATAVRLQPPCTPKQLGADTLWLVTPCGFTLELKKGGMLVISGNESRVQADVLLANGNTINAQAAKLLVEADNKRGIVVRGLP